MPSQADSTSYVIQYASDTPIVIVDSSLMGSSYLFKSFKAELFKVRLKSQDILRKRRKADYVLRITTPLMTYIGEYQCKNTVGKYIGLANEELKILYLHPALYFFLKPALEDDIYEIALLTDGGDTLRANAICDSEGRPVLMTGAAATTSQLTTKEEVNRLKSIFGSHKTKSMVKKYANNKTVKSDNLQQSLALLGSTNKPSTSEPPTPDQEEEEDNVIPVHENGATSIEKAFSLESILSENDFEVLADPAEVFTNSSFTDISTWTKESKYPAFVLRCLDILPSNAEKRKEVASIIIYIKFLIDLFNMKPKELQRKDPLPKEIPDKIKKKTT